MLSAVVSSCGTSAYSLAHTSWLFEQIVAPPVLTSKDQSRTQVQGSLVTFTDTVSIQASGTIDLNAVEARLFASQRFFPAISPQGKENKSLLSDVKQTIGAEIGRYYATQDRHSGRLALGVYRFEPASHTFFKLGLDTGIQLAGTPWSASLGAAVFFSLPRGNDVLQLHGEALSESAIGSLRLKLGGFLSFTNRLADMTPAGPGTYESMLLSFGPAGELVTGIGIFRLTVNLRLFLNKKIDPAGNTNPSEFGLPDVSLGWGQLL